MDAIGPIFQGNAQAQQYIDQAAMAQQQARDVGTQEVEASGQRREQLNSSLANIAANRAQAGLSLDSPTAIAIGSAVNATSNRAQAISRLGSLNQEQSLQTQGSLYSSAASNAITGSYINAFTAVGKDATNAFAAGA